MEPAKDALYGAIAMTKKKNSKNIPPPPGPHTSWEEEAKYFEKHDWDDLRQRVICSQSRTKIEC